MGVKLANRVVFTSTGRDYHFPRQRGRQGLTAKVIKCDAFRFHAQVVQHSENRRIHHRWTTNVVLDVLGGHVVLQVVVQQHLVDEPFVASPVVLR